jgi:hypothetical protein
MFSSSNDGRRWAAAGSALAAALVALAFAVPGVATGAAWDAPTQLDATSLAEYMGYPYQPAIATDPDGNVHVVWYRTVNGRNAIFYRRWDAGGAAWGEVESIAYHNTATYFRPGVACDAAGNVHVVWYSSYTGAYGIYYKKWENGSGWQDQVRIYDPGANYLQYHPSVACPPGGNNVHVTWQARISTTLYQVFHLEYVPGEGWGSVTRVDDNDVYSAEAVGARVDAANNVYVTWLQTPDGSANNRVWTRARIGGSWQGIVQVSPAALDGQTQYAPCPAVDAAGTKLHVVWRSQSYVVYHRVLDLESGTWDDAEVVINNTFLQDNPGIALDRDGNPHVVWRGRPESAGDYHIWHRAKVGADWQPVEQVSTQLLAYQNPSIAIEPDGRLHVAWYAADPWYCRGQLANDVGATAIAVPGDTVGFGEMVRPRVTVENFGDLAATFPLEVTITGPNDAVWQAEEQVTGLAAGESRVHVFTAGWTATPTGEYTVSAVTKLAGDADPGNDGAGPNGFVVYLAPPGPFSLVAPADGAVDQPRTLTLDWTAADGADGYDVYLDAVNPPVARVGRDVVPTEYEARNLAGERTYYWQVVAKNAAGSTASAVWSFTVEPGLPPGWVEVASMPAAPSGRAIKDGGLLMDGGDVLYATKGYKVGDFYSYNIATNTWTQLPPLPGGPSGKGPGKGAAGCVDGRYVYVVKGNNTVEFWRFDTDPGVFAWIQLVDVPLGNSGTKVKSGSDLVVMKAGVGQTPTYLYLLKGKKSDFLRYNPDPEVLNWEVMPNTPIGGRERWDKGSWLAAHRRHQDGIYHIYAHKAKYHELWRFQADTETWDTQALPGMPLVGMISRPKKSKDGGSAAFEDRALWALKGGNTQEFWRFGLDSLNWREYDTIPAIGSTGKKKRVKVGGDIVAGPEAFYAFKGNKCLELWRYVIPPPMPADRPGPGGVAAGETPAEQPGLTVGPNPPAGGAVTVRYTLPAGGSASIRVYDASGRVVLERGLAARSGALRLDLRGLSAGVYLVKLEAAGYSATRKLVVQQ